MPLRTMVNRMPICVRANRFASTRREIPGFLWHVLSRYLESIHHTKIWCLRPFLDSLPKLIIFMSRFLNLTMARVHVEFDVEEEIKETPASL